VVSEPVRSGDGYRLLRVKARSDGSPLRFEDTREVVRAEWQRRATEEQLRSFLSDRRARAKVALSPELGS
jgi:parvulin-like peptidyl-prolyl isomerase